MTPSGPASIYRASVRGLRELVTQARIAYYKAISTGTFSGTHPRFVSPVLVIDRNGSGQRSDVGLLAVANLTGGYIHIQAAVATPNPHGSNTILNNGTILMAEGPGIEIGSDVMIGRNTEIYDSDRHHLDPMQRNTGVPNMGRVVVEDNVFIGSGVKIGKGVRIGRDSVIGMGSVVTTDVPASVVAAGNPCRVIRQLQF